VLCRIEGVLTPDRVADRKARLTKALQEHPESKTAIFELSIPGGESTRSGDGATEVDAACELADFILNDLKSFQTIAYVRPEQQVLGVGVLAALAPKVLILGKDSRLGADLGRNEGTGPPAEKLRKKLREVAGARGYDDLIVSAMVAPASENLYLQRYTRVNQPEAVRCITQSTLENPWNDQERAARVGEPRLIVAKGKRLVISAQEAYQPYQLVRHVAKDLNDLRLVLQLPVADENIIDVDSGPLKSSSPGAQSFIDFLNSPFARFVLILLGSLALLVELKTFGTIIPGAISCACFAMFFVASSFPVTGSTEGTASLWEVLVFVIGAGLMAVEFLLLPGVGIFAVSGAAVCAVAIVLAMVPADAASLGDREMSDVVVNAIATLAYGFGTGCACFLFLLRFISKRSTLARRGLVTTAAITGVPTADTALEAQAAQQEIIGRIGCAVTMLRPAGKVELDDGRILDVVAEGSFVEPQRMVRVLSAAGGVIRVSEILPPPGALNAGKQEGQA